MPGDHEERWRRRPQMESNRKRKTILFLLTDCVQHEYDKRHIHVTANGLLAHANEWKGKRTRPTPAAAASNNRKSVLHDLIRHTTAAQKQYNYYLLAVCCVCIVYVVIIIWFCFGDVFFSVVWPYFDSPLLGIRFSNVLFSHFFLRSASMPLNCKINFSSIDFASEFFVCVHCVQQVRSCGPGHTNASPNFITFFFILVVARVRCTYTPSFIH